MREKRTLPILDDVLHKLTGSTVFSKLDASSGFLQIPLDPGSSKLTTFITPFGRYCFRRLPFGITSAPEIFQDKMEQLLEGLPGVEFIMDDILIHGETRAKHDEHYKNVLRVIRASGLKLNKDKCLLRRSKLVFMGNLISKDGLEPDPEKVDAICKMSAPENVTELRRLLGMANYLYRFLPDLSTVLKPMTDLLKSDMAWVWSTGQEHAFEQLKIMVTTSPVLAFYDPNLPTVVSAYASSYGLGAVILQLHGYKLLPVAYASRTLTDTEKRYAQIEKELLASTWACEKFARYLVGLKSFTLQTDHKPLITIINSQDLDKAPIRCQRLLMRLMRFSICAKYVPGKELTVADALSRTPLESTGIPDTEQEIQAHVDATLETKPVSPQKLTQIKHETATDEQL